MRILISFVSVYMKPAPRLWRGEKISRNLVRGQFFRRFSTKNVFSTKTEMARVFWATKVRALLLLDNTFIHMYMSRFLCISAAFGKIRTSFAALLWGCPLLQIEHPMLCARVLFSREVTPETQLYFLGIQIWELIGLVRNFDLAPPDFHPTRYALQK